MAAQPDQLRFAIAQGAVDDEDACDAGRELHEGAFRTDKHWESFEATLCARMHATHVVFAITYCEVPGQGGFMLHQDPASRPTTIELRSALQVMRSVFAGIRRDVPITLEEVALHGDEEVRSTCSSWLTDSSNPRLIALDVNGPENTVARLRLVRPGARGMLTESERAYLRSLVPHIRSAAGTFLRVQRLIAERSLLAEQLLPATILLDASGAVVQISDSARSLLAHERNLSLEQGRIKILHAQEASAFQDLLGRAMRAVNEGRVASVDAMRIRRTSAKTPMWLVVRALETHHIGEPHRIAIMLHTHDVEPDVPLEALQHLLGLTRSETAVALRLARGKTVKEVTQELGVSVSTTRAHLRSIFAKTCIDKQTKLVRTVLQGVAMLSCR